MADGILKKLQTKGSLLTPWNGQTPKNIAEDPQSKLHFSYSLDGTPKINNKPLPSKLDLNGKTPSKYLYNLPN